MDSRKYTSGKAEQHPLRKPGKQHFLLKDAGLLPSSQHGDTWRFSSFTSPQATQGETSKAAPWYSLADALHGISNQTDSIC